MSASINHQYEDISLWSSFHDGTLESFAHDPLSRTMTVTIEVPYIATFHAMTSETRFKLVLEEVSMLEVAQFQPWPGDAIIPDGLSWDEQQKIRNDIYNKGCKHSNDWAAFLSSLSERNEYEISNAVITPSKEESSTLIFELSDFGKNEYPCVRMTGSHIHFFVNDNELEQTNFLSLGEAYWDAFAKRSAAVKATN